MKLVITEGMEFKLRDCRVELRVLELRRWMKLLQDVPLRARDCKLGSSAMYLQWGIAKAQLWSERNSTF
jgi:hypothetical protein